MSQIPLSSNSSACDVCHSEIDPGTGATDSSSSAGYRAIMNPLLSLALVMLGSCFFSIIIATHLKMWRCSELTIGFVQAAYYAGLLVGGGLAPSLISRYGHVKSYQISALGLLISLGLMGLIYQVSAWWIFRFLFGASTAVIYVIIESWLLLLTDAKRRGSVISLYMIVLYGAQSLSPHLLAWTGYGSLAFLVGISLCGLSVLPLIGKTRALPFLKSQKLSIRTLWSLAPFGVAGCLIGGVIQGSIYAAIPSLALALDYSPEILLSMAILGGGLMQWPIGMASDRWGRRPLLLGISLLMLLPYLLLTALGTDWITVVAVCFLTGGLAFALYSLGLAQIGDQLPSSQMTAAAAQLLIVYSLGSIMGPILAAGSMMPSPIGLFIFYAATGLLLAVVGWFKPSKPVNEGNSLGL